MQPRFSLDRDLRIPLVVSVISILGIVWIFLTNDRRQATPPPPPEPTVAFDVSPFQTEMAALFPSPLPERTDPPSLMETPVEPLPSTSVPVTESPPVPSATSTPDAPPPLTVGRHDNTDPGIMYDRRWSSEMNSGTKYAYKGTLHVSFGIGNEASFRFTGERFYFGYQRGRNLGTVTVMIDDQTYSFHEQAFGNIWRSPSLSPGTHAVRIIHDSGESINLDYIEVLD